MIDQESAILTDRTSALETGRGRFLAHVIEHAFECGRRTPADFVRHFPPAAIMEGLQDQPDLRAEILVSTTGVKHKVALKKSWQSCSDDLQIALEEGETNAEAIVRLFTMDDRVRFLDAQALWAFVTEGDFWKTSPSRQKEYAAAKAHMAFMLSRALSDKLIQHADIVEGITVEEIASRLPKSELGKIIKGALECGKQNAPFLEIDLLNRMPPDVIVNYVPLFQVWDSVIEPRIAAAHGYSSLLMRAVPARVSLSPYTEADQEGANATIALDAMLTVPGDDDVPQPQPLRTGEDPQRWTQEFAEESDFVDAADLLDEEPAVHRSSTPPDGA